MTRQLSIHSLSADVVALVTKCNCRDSSTTTVKHGGAREFANFANHAHLQRSRSVVYLREVSTLALSLVST